MKKDRKLIITEKQLMRVNESLVGNDTHQAPTRGTYIAQVNGGEITSDDVKQAGDEAKSQGYDSAEIQGGNGKNITGVNYGDNFMPGDNNVVRISGINNKIYEGHSFTKKSVEEARIRTIKQEGKTYTKKDFAKMILEK